MAGEIRRRIEAANEEAAARIIAGEPVLMDIAPAGEVIPGLTDRMILHAGPPIEWARMCGAQRGAAIGMALFEGWARTPAEAGQLPQRGGVQLPPHHQPRA